MLLRISKHVLDERSHRQKLDRNELEANEANFHQLKKLIVGAAALLKAESA